jgi:hypothetical protein
MTITRLGDFDERSVDSRSWTSRPDTYDLVSMSLWWQPTLAERSCCKSTLRNTKIIVVVHGNILKRAKYSQYLHSQMGALPRQSLLERTEGSRCQN